MKLPSCKLGNAGQAVEQVENKTWQPKGRSLSLSLSFFCTIEFRNVDLLILIKLDKGLRCFIGQTLHVCQVLTYRDSIEIWGSHARTHTHTHTNITALQDISRL
jgi:hypothetical protein